VHALVEGSGWQHLSTHLSRCVKVASHRCQLSSVPLLKHHLLLLPFALLAAEFILVLDAALQVQQQPDIVLALVVTILPARGSHSSQGQP
jgi:hypothetical protein